MSIGSERDLEGLRRAGRVVALALAAARESLEPGMTTADVDRVAEAVLERHGARSAPRETYGFPGAICISVDDEAVHGVPGDRVLEVGDLVKLDVTADLDGYVADAAVSAGVPPLAAPAERIAACAHAALAAGIRQARAGRRLNAIGRSVEREVGQHGFTVLSALCGHGVGRTIHEEPTVPMVYDPRFGQRLTEGLVITIEPIVAAGRDALVTDADGWTVRTGDGALSAHAEHTIVVTRGRPLVLTAAA